jgi:hypothetical protein
MGLLDPAIEPPVVIHTVPHTPCDCLNRCKTKQLGMSKRNCPTEFLSFPHRSRYFLVAEKGSGGWRFINDVQALNKVSIRDSGMPPAVDKFSEDFAGYPITSSIDY